MYRVFLSSTSRDLQAYRAAVHQAIDRLRRFHLVMMEDFTSSGKTPKQICDEEVRSSELFVGLLSHYYGSCPPQQTVSFTELEYRAAIDAGIEPLMFVAPDDLAVPISLREPDESFERQQSFRKAVLESHIADGFRTPDDLAAKVTAALANWANNQKTSTSTCLQEAPSKFQVWSDEEAQSKKSLGANPYRGLEAFRLVDANRFFGRGAFIEKLWQRLLELHGQGYQDRPPIRLLAIIGASGSGKSSLAQAGLLAEIKKRPLPGRIDPEIAIFTPEARPLESLAMALAKLVSDDAIPVDEAKKFETFLQNSKNGDGLRYLGNNFPKKQPVILLVDQFEETFSLCDDEDERVAFILNLLSVARQPNGSLSVIIVLRSDFLGAVNDHPELSTLIAAQNEVVPVMGEDELRRAIEEPANAAGRPLDPAVVDLLIEQSAGERGALPLLEFALTRIWDGLREGKAETETLRELGGVGGALAKEARTLFAGLREKDEVIAKRAFLAMVRLGENTKDTRRRAPIQEIVAAGEDQTDVEHVLSLFSNPTCRLITMAGTEDGGKTVEVSHEALIDEWLDLRRWLDEGRDDERFRRRLNEAATAWKSKKGGLWTSIDLGRLRFFVSKHHSSMTPLQLDFFKASERQRKRVRRIRGLAISMLVALTVTSVVFGLYAIQQQRIADEQRQLAEQQAQIAEARRLDADGQARISTANLMRAALFNLSTLMTGLTRQIALAEQLPQARRLANLDSRYQKITDELQEKIEEGENLNDLNLNNYVDIITEMRQYDRLYLDIAVENLREDILDGQPSLAFPFSLLVDHLYEAVPDDARGSDFWRVQILDALEARG